jgi:hypothetical protein
MRAFRSERGQALVLTTMTLFGLLGMTAFVVDVGSWFRAQRDTQAIADAAALAGAQELPENMAAAKDLAVHYAKENGSDSPKISFSTTGSGTKPNTIHVEIRKDTPGFIARMFKIEVVNVGAKAAARASNIGAAQWAAPIGVDHLHPLIAGCEPDPCFGKETTLDLKKTGPGAFRILNIDGSKGGTGPGTLEDWMLRGLDATMKVDEWYWSDPGAKFNSSSVQNALRKREGTEMLFPIYDDVKGGGANLQYHVIGWIGFIPADGSADACECRGSSGTITGTFTRVIWAGIQTEDTGAADFGVRAIELIE